LKKILLSAVLLVTYSVSGVFDFSKIDICNPKNDIEKQAIVDAVKSEISTALPSFSTGIELSSNGVIGKLLKGVALKLGYTKSFKIRVDNTTIMTNNLYVKEKFTGCLDNTVFIGSNVLNYLNYDEFVALLGHEIGHLKCHHVYKKIAVLLLSTASFAGLGYYVSGKLGFDIDSNGYVFYKNKKMGYFKSNVFSQLAQGVVAIPVILVSMKKSRDYEFEADQESLAVISDPDVIISGLDKIYLNAGVDPYKKNTAWYAPIAKFFTTHPNNKSRHVRLKEYAATVKSA
jgi:hypothetical protein